MLANVSETFLRFVTETDFAVPVLPSTTDPKLTLLVDVVTGTIPVPVRLTVC
jgi:hypothetical protein